MNPNEAAKQIGKELGQSNAKGDARLASALAQPTTQHTGGEWEVGVCTINGARVLAVAPLGTEDIPKPARIVCSVSTMEKVDELDYAYARLIAASPCLLAACGEALSAIEAWNDKDDDAEAGLRAAALLLADAIAKATQPNVPPVSP